MLERMWKEWFQGLPGSLWAGYRRRYSNWLRAGRAGNRMPLGGEIFRTCPHRPWGPPSLLYKGYRVVPGGKERPGRDADHSPPSSAVAKKEYSYTSTPPMGRTVCTETQCLYNGALYVTFTPKSSRQNWGKQQNLQLEWHPEVNMDHGPRKYVL